MSADGSVTTVWGDGENKFRFAIGQFRELQEKINARRIHIGAPLVGPMTLINSLRQQDTWPDDVRDILRIGLVGGGLTAAEAHRKLVLYFDNSPPAEHMVTAYMILVAGFIGVPEDEIKKKAPETTETKTSQSDSQESTGPVLQ
jgi:Phage tail tube protein, GTA-gp10